MTVATMDFADLAGELEALFGLGVERPWDERQFNAMALRVFGYQFANNAIFRGFCEGRGCTPRSVTRWQDVPAVPTTAFKHLDLISGDPGAAEATYLTSGTTAGLRGRGRHAVPRLSVYRASALSSLRAYLLPEDEGLPVLSLIPSPEQAPQSSLSAMMGFLAERWGQPTHWLTAPGGGPDVSAFLAVARRASEKGAPVLVAGTAFAFVHLTDAMAGDGVAVELPPGSGLMETGGFKGRSRQVERDDLYGALERRLGIPPQRIVNEYGMTELLSQLYEPVLRDGRHAGSRHVPPPWMRVRALEPTTLEEVPEGTPGLLTFFDLANVGSVSHILTQDVGSVDGSGVRLLGREPGSEPRGCSLALEEILSGEGGRW